jgi:hypothetical protein
LSLANNNNSNNKPKKVNNQMKINHTVRHAVEDGPNQKKNV